MLEASGGVTLDDRARDRRDRRRLDFRRRADALGAGDGSRARLRVAIYPLMRANGVVQRRRSKCFETQRRQRRLAMW